MRPNIHHHNVIDTILEIIEDWKSTNDIKSPSHYNLIATHLETQLEDMYRDNYIEAIDRTLCTLYRLAKDAEIYVDLDDYINPTKLFN